MKKLCQIVSYFLLIKGSFFLVSLSINPIAQKKEYAFFILALTFIGAFLKGNELSRYKKTQMFLIEGLMGLSLYELYILVFYTKDLQNLLASQWNLWLGIFIAALSISIFNRHQQESCIKINNQN